LVLILRVLLKIADIDDENDFREEIYARDLKDLVNERLSGLIKKVFDFHREYLIFSKRGFKISISRLIKKSNPGFSGLLFFSSKNRESRCIEVWQK